MKLSRFFRAAAIPLDRDATGRFLPVVVAIMVLLASLLLVCALALGKGLSSWRGVLEGHATVQILPLDDRAEPLPQRVEMAVGLLEQSPLVAHASPLSAEDMAQLLGPWLGEGSLPEDLPVPALIDVELAADAGDLSPLREVLQPVAGASLDDHGSWLGDVRRLARLVVGLSYGLVLLIVGAAGLIVVLLVRAGMAMHRDVVELLHLVGAADGFIAWQFQRHMSFVALQGALAGGAGAFLLLQVLHGMADRAGLHILTALDPWQNGWTLAVVPLGFVLLAALTSGVVARRLLAELP